VPANPLENLGFHPHEQIQMEPKQAFIDLYVIDPDGLFQHRFEGPITADDIATEISRAR